MAKEKEDSGARRGRPPAEHPYRTPVTTWIPDVTAQRLFALAHRRGEHVSHVVRTLVIARLGSQ